MQNPLAMKLEQFTAFQPSERMRLDELLGLPAKKYRRGQAIVREGEKMDQIHLVVRGFAGRAKTLEDGSLSSWPS